jgi:hypothetical protein
MLRNFLTSIFILLISFSSILSAETNACEDNLIFKEFRVGASTIHRYTDPSRPEHFAITIWVPLAQKDNPKRFRYLNLNSKIYTKLPTRFILSDGWSHSRFYEIDLRKDSALNQLIDKIIKSMMESGVEINTEASIIESLRNFKNTIKSWPKFSLSTSLAQPSRYVEKLNWKTFSDAYKQMPEETPLETNTLFQAVPIEWATPNDTSLCISKSLWTSLILNRLNIKHRIVNGATWVAPGLTYGHTWIELNDGRVLDPEWETLETPTYDNNFIYFNNKKRIQYHNYPILEILQKFEN